jgi:hypothetical protein
MIRLTQTFRDHQGREVARHYDYDMGLSKAIKRITRLFGLPSLVSYEINKHKSSSWRDKGFTVKFSIDEVSNDQPKPKDSTESQLDATDERLNYIDDKRERHSKEL